MNTNYFEHDGKFYNCIGNDDNKFWAVVNDLTVGFEQSNCTELVVKDSYKAADLYTGRPILVNGALSTVDHIKPYETSVTTKNGFVIVFEGTGENKDCILETEDSDIVKLLAANP